MSLLVLLIDLGQPALEVHEGHNIDEFQFGAFGLPRPPAPLLVELLIFLFAEDENVGGVVIGVVLEHWYFDGLFDGVDEHAFPHFVEGLVVDHILGYYFQHV